MTSPDILGGARYSYSGVQLQTAVEGGSFMLTPSYIKKIDSSPVGGTLQAAHNDTVQLNLALQQEDPDDGESLRISRETVIFPLYRNPGSSISFMGTFADKEEKFDYQEMGVSFGHRLSEHVALFGNVNWAKLDPVIAPSVVDTGATAGIELPSIVELEKVGITLSSDYTFENDISNESDYSVTTAFGLIGARESFLLVGASKHHVYRLLFTIPF